MAIDQMKIYLLGCSRYDRNAFGTIVTVPLFFQNYLDQKVATDVADQIFSEWDLDWLGTWSVVRGIAGLVRQRSAYGPRAYCIARITELDVNDPTPFI